MFAEKVVIITGASSGLGRQVDHHVKWLTLKQLLHARAIVDTQMKEAKAIGRFK